MIIGQALLSDDSTTGDVYFSPWFPRGGNKAVMSCDLIAVSDASRLGSMRKGEHPRFYWLRVVPGCRSPRAP